MALTDILGIGPTFADRLKEAGISDEAALAAATDLDTLAESTGIPRARLEEFREHARQAHEKSPTEALHEVADAVRKATDEMRVVLADRAATARVKIGSIWHEDVPIVTAKFEESEQRIMESLRENAVLLKERAHVAFVRVNGEVHENIPIFKERVKEGADQVREEIRVKVHEIRERKSGSGNNILGKLFKKDETKGQ